MKKIMFFLFLIMLSGMFTTICAQSITIGTLASTSSNLPITGNYGYNYTQQIYLQTQIASAVQIQKLRFWYASGLIASSKDWVVYMGHTTKTTFSSTTDWVPLASLTQVYSGDVTSLVPGVAGWMEITLSSPFSYNNTDNLVIAVDENTSGYSSMSWGSFTSGANTGIYYRNDSTNPNPASPPTASGRTSNINYIQLVLPSTTPPNPAISFVPVDLATGIARNAILTWADGGGGPTGYKVYFGTDNPPTTYINSTPQSGTSYTPPIMSSNTWYYWTIIPTNANGDATGYVVNSFKTSASLAYATSTATSTADDDIGQFTLGSFANPVTAPTPVLSNPTAVNMYTDYTALGPINISQLATTPLSIYQIEGSTTFYSCGIRVFIDYNQNGNFDLPGEIAFEGATTSGGAINPLTGNMIVPITAMLGNTRLRVVLVESAAGSAVQPTGTYSWGETEDYTVNIQEPPAMPTFSINPTSKDFGMQLINTPASQTFIITNTGGGTLSINSSNIVFASGSSPYFSFNPAPTSMNLTSGQTGTIIVKYLPTAIGGPYTATVNITDNIAKSFHTIALTGSCYDPTITTFPYTEGFDAVSFPPLGWSNYGVTKSNGSRTSDTFWSRVTSGTYNTSAGAAKVLYNHSALIWGCLELPPANLPANHSLSFYWRDNDSKIAAHDTTFCEISTNGGITWTVLATLSAASTQSTYQLVDVSLNAYTGNGRLIRFRDGTDAAGAAYGTFLDELKISLSTIPPNAVSTPTPANAATGVAINTNLSWVSGGGAPNGYKVYRGIVSGSLTQIADQAGTTFLSTGSLLFNTQYFWRVDAYNDYGTTAGPEWSFTTTTGQPAVTSPANLATNVAANLPVLDWADVGGASGYLVRIGTTPGGSEITSAANTGTTSSYTNGSNWPFSTTIYWQVTVQNGAQSVVGTEWSFTTGADPTINDLPALISFSLATDTNGWIQSWSSGYTAALWSSSATNLAGGNSPELKHGYGSNQTVAQWSRLLSPPINVTGLSSVNVSWRNYLDWDQIYNTVGLTMKFQYSYNGVDFTDLWTLVGSADVPAEVHSFPITLAKASTLYLSWYTTGNAYDLNGWYIDDIRVMPPNSQVIETTLTGGTGTVTMPAITVDGAPLITTVGFAGLTGSPIVETSVEYQPTDVTLLNAGLVFTFSGASFGGTTITITHNLGFVPMQLAYRIDPNATFILVNNPGNGSWTTSTVSFVVGQKAEGDLQVVLPQDAEDTLPVEMSSFTAVLTDELFVNLNWVVQSETNNLGYNVLRSYDTDLNNSIAVNSAMISTGTATGTEITYKFTDQEVEMNTNYYYWLENVSLNGESEFYGPVMVTVGQPSEENPTPVVPIVTALLDAYPNPFNPITNLQYVVKDAGAVTIDVYNVRGQLIRSFSANHAKAGHYRFVWNGKDMNGNEVSSGVYFYRMTSGKYSASKKIIMMK